MQAARSNPSSTLIGPFARPGEPPRATTPALVAASGDAMLPTRSFAEDGSLDVERPLLPLAPGATIAGTRYRLVRWLGDGGMGVVYEAEHIDLRRRVALKILRTDACRRPEFVDMFRAEACTVARIQSDYIVQVYDFAEVADGRALFTMELLEGRTLRSHITEGPIDAARTIAIARQACKGLAAAHDAGVVHRDIKPENVFLTRRRGRNDAVRLLDFGVSAILADARLAASRAAGTPWYLAPERVAGLAHDGRADIYALGCTLYEMLSGVRPFQGDEHEVLVEHLERDPPALLEVAPDRAIPSALAAVVMRCLAKQPQDRPATAAELEAALCEAQIEAGLHTAWDDLPIPDIDPVARERLLRAMPDPFARPESRGARLRWGIGIVVATSAIVATAATMLPRNAALERIESLTIDARAAAAQDYFLYPPATSPETPTAFAFVLELEQVGGLGSFAATRRANYLRREFADTLARLGDRYWDHPAGRAFAVDYYAEALVFVHDHPTASERAALSPGHLAELERKAQEMSFTAPELAAVAPLVALAKDDPIELRDAVIELRSATPVWGTRIDAQIDQIVEAATPADTAATDAPTITAGLGEPTEPVVPLAEERRPPDDGGANERPAAVTPTVPEPATTPGTATKRWLAEGRAHLARGSIAAARRSFERVLAEQPRHAGALAGLARTAFEEGDYVEAARFAERAVAQAPGRADHVILLGDAYFKSFRYADAEVQYRRAAMLGHPSAQARLAKVRQKPR